MKYSRIQFAVPTPISAKMKVFKKIELNLDGYGRRQYFNVVDIDIATAKDIGYYTVDVGGDELLINGCALLEAERNLVLRTR